MEEEVRARRQAEAAQRPLPARLQAATSKATQAASAKQRAQQAVQAAQLALQTAEEKFAAAAKVESDAQDELKTISAEVSQAQDAERPAPLPPPATSQALEALLAAVRAAASVGAEQNPDARAKLEQAAADAETALRPPQQAEQVQQQSGPAARGQTRPAPSQAEEPTLTQRGDSDMTDEALEELIGNLSPTKRSRVAERLTQLGVQEQQEGR